MKIFYAVFLFIFLFTCKAFPEDTTAIIHINTLSDEGTVLDKGWKFHTGDNAEWKNPDYDDKDWQSINPTLDIHDSLPQIPRSGICWFRLHLSVDSDLLKNQLALIVQQSGASEIYVNGKLLYRFGIVDNEPEKVEAYNPWGKPIPFIVDKDTQFVICVRYALQQNAKYSTIYSLGNSALQIKINISETALNQYVHESTRVMSSSIFRLGVFSMFVILHLAFYLFYPSQKANLHFCLFAMFIVSADIIGVNKLDGINISNNVVEIFYGLNIAADLLQVSSFFLLTALYTLFDEKKKWIYWALLCSVIVGILLNTSYHLSWANPFILNNLIYIEIVRIGFKSVKNGKRGSGIIAIGCICFVIFWMSFILGVPFRYINTHVNSTYTLGDLTYNLMNLSIPIATSIYLGLDFAYTSFSLKQKLAEVEQLSEEKQQILTSQKEMLERQVQDRTAELKHSLENLKSTQAQLIQSEKMASLGELTAGIAHEIQNPLNFVNNFSEVNKEMIAELKEEIDKGNYEEVKLIASDIEDNEEKINHHGKRADAIVKGMLQHSRASAGVKEPTDINKLADEYLRLSYHGMRAKDKSFDADIKTDFNESIGKINVIPQDIGRVLLNLFNNAFYAVNEKLKAQSSPLMADYKPLVSVQTKRVNDKVEIRVTDNGNGIPRNIVDKIFQPFFTTKPTGQGTGLGLSLAYDIIKTHGGEIKVKSKESEGAEFMIELPLKQNA
jgi:signal transduction histidine kinase